MNERPPLPKDPFVKRRRRGELTTLESFLLTIASAGLTLLVGAALGALLWWATFQLGLSWWEASRHFRIILGMAVGFFCLFASMSGAWEYVGFGIGILILTIAPYYVGSLLSAAG